MAPNPKTTQDSQSFQKTADGTSFTGPCFSVSGILRIISEKLNGKNYLAWSAFVELWFLGQGQQGHFKKSSDKIAEEKHSEWKRFNYQLCALLWQYVES